MTSPTIRSPGSQTWDSAHSFTRPTIRLEDGMEKNDKCYDEIAMTGLPGLKSRGVRP
jgi:hypothetical protein